MFRRAWLCSFIVFFAALSPAHATPIEMVFEFTGGFTISRNGAPEAPSGPLTFTTRLDSTSPDIEPDIGRGTFAADWVRLTAPNYGLVDELVIAASPTIITFGGGISLLLSGIFNEVGWNGGPGAMRS